MKRTASKEKHKPKAGELPILAVEELRWQEEVRSMLSPYWSFRMERQGGAIERAA